MFASKDVARPAHVGCELVDHVDPVDSGTRIVNICEIAEQKLIGCGIAKLMPLDIRTSDPKPLMLETAHQVTTDKSTCTCDENSFC
jgi:hypothetical protein